MTEPLNIYLWLEDYDNSELAEYDRLEQLREAVKVYNYQYNTNYMPDSTVQRYERMKRFNIEI